METYVTLDEMLLFRETKVRLQEKLSERYIGVIPTGNTPFLFVKSEICRKM